MNIARFALFISVFSLVYFGMHYFVYLRLVWGGSLGQRESVLLKLFLAAGSLAFFAGMFHRAYPPLFVFLRMGNVWLGVMAIAVAVFVAKMPLDFIFPGQAKLSTLFAAILVFAASGYSLYNVSGGPVVKQLQLPAANLPVGVDSITVAHISDLHLSRLNDVAWLEGVVDAVNRQNADIVVITGDIIDDDMDGLKAFVPALRKLKSKYGVFAVAGNHDHYSELGNMYSLARAGGIRVLSNEKISVGGVVDILGVDDENDEVMDNYQKFLADTLKGGHLPVILLKHRPTSFEAAASAGVLLQLSGHTHAGQIPPLDLIVRLIFKYPYGMYRRGGSYIHTTCGTGTWGPPMRLFSRSEITVVTLFRQTGRP